VLRGLGRLDRCAVVAGVLGWLAVSALGLWAALCAAFIGIGGRKLLSGPTAVAGGGTVRAVGEYPAAFHRHDGRCAR
jgi:hypothetical protein